MVSTHRARALGEPRRIDVGRTALPRLRSLDSLRGAAAVVVLLNHYLLTLPDTVEDRARLMSQGFSAPWAWLYLTPLRLVVDGFGAVLVFFVLSGLALGLSFDAVD